MKIPENWKTKQILRDINQCQSQIQEELENSQKLEIYLSSLISLEENVKFLLQKMSQGIQYTLMQF